MREGFDVVGVVEGVLDGLREGERDGVRDGEAVVGCCVGLCVGELVAAGRQTHTCRAPPAPESHPNDVPPRKLGLSLICVLTGKFSSPVPEVDVQSLHVAPTTPAVVIPVYTGFPVNDGIVPNALVRGPLNSVAQFGAICVPPDPTTLAVAENTVPLTGTRLIDSTLPSLA